MGGAAEVQVCLQIASVEISLQVDKLTSGRQLLQHAADCMGVQQTQPFGLRFVDRKGTHTWLCANETLASSRLRKESPLHLAFRVRFWPCDIAAEVTDEMALSLLFRQLQAALESGELCCPHSQTAQLQALALQVQCGDLADDAPATCGCGGLPPGLPSDAQHAWRQKVACLHRQQRGLSAPDAIRRYAGLAQQLPSYGVTYFTVTGGGQQLWLGVTADGIGVYEDRLTPMLTFQWARLCSISFSGRELTLRLRAGRRKYVYHMARQQISLDVMLLAHGYCSRYHRRIVANVDTSGYEVYQLSFRHRSSNSETDGREEEAQRRGGETAASDGAGHTTPTEVASDAAPAAVLPSMSAAGASGEEPAQLPAEDSVPDASKRPSSAPASRDSSAGASGGSDEYVPADTSLESVLDEVVRQMEGIAATAKAGAADPAKSADSSVESRSEAANGGTTQVGRSGDGEGSSCDPLRAEEQWGDGARSRQALSMETELWGPFVQSLMAPD